MFQNLIRRQHTRVPEVEILLLHILDANSRPTMALKQHIVCVTQICATPEMTHVASDQHG